MKEAEYIGMKEGKHLFSLSGEIESSIADEFFNSVSAAYELAPGNIEFSCEKLDFIDSTTLGTFVKILKKAKTDGYSICLCGLQPKIKKLFLICALDKIMEID